MSQSEFEFDKGLVWSDPPSWQGSHLASCTCFQQPYYSHEPYVGLNEVGANGTWITHGRGWICVKRRAKQSQLASLEWILNPVIRKNGRKRLNKIATKMMNIYKEKMETSSWSGVRKNSICLFKWFQLLIHIKDNSELCSSSIAANKLLQRTSFLSLNLHSMTCI